MKLWEHNTTLRGGKSTLRPMTEGDWDILLRWNRDPEVLYFTDIDVVAPRELPDVQEMYRGVSRNAFCFIIEVGGEPVGECWLQKMNLERVLREYPGKDCRRIDLMIGEKGLWGKGIGTDVISTLTRFGFENEKADFVFGCDIADYNPRSLRVFQKNGYRIEAEMVQPPGNKAGIIYDLVLSKDEYYRRERRA
ncbi:MAG: GNAT family N-acetyltransferase [Dehalococcoidales bacterium]|nr:MAG: GNAT family N-acetyltransferase [Dehalococcoidales bacterium]